MVIREYIGVHDVVLGLREGTYTRAGIKGQDEDTAPNVQ